MDDNPRRGNPIATFLMLIALVGGGFYFFRNYEISGLDGVSVRQKGGVNTSESLVDQSFTVALPESTTLVNTGRPTTTVTASDAPEQNDSFLAGWIGPTQSSKPVSQPERVRNLKIGSWAMGGLGASKREDGFARQNIVRIAQGFDVLALQQISAPERDLIPRLVDAMNEGGRHFDYVLGSERFDHTHPEQLAVVFNLNRVSVDRSQTYSVADPGGTMTYDPLVTWFRAKEVDAASAWTFSLVNVRVDLKRAAAEVAVLPSIFSAVRMDGRGEDDVVMVGLFQADDRYMIPQVMGHEAVVAVRSVPTDIFGRHQTCNVIVHRHRTSEFLGRGGVLDFPQVYQLTVSEAETVSPHLPVFAEFTPTEGGAP